MARSDEDFAHAPQQSSTGVSSQESGLDGLSSDMKYTFHDSCAENIHPVKEKSCLVKPIFKEEEDFENSKLAVGFPVLGHECGDEEESIKEPIEVQLTQPPISPLSHDVQKPKEELAAATHTDAHVDTVKGRTTARMGGSNGKMYHKRGEGKKWKLFQWVCLVACLLPVSGLFAAGDPLPSSVPGLSEQTNNDNDERAKCFTCNDRDRCPNLRTIFDNDETVFERLGTPFPPCAGSPEPAPKTCIVCHHQEETRFICSEINSIEAEDDRSRHLGLINITEGCTGDPLPISDPGVNELTNNDGDPLPTSDSELSEQTNNDVGSRRWLNGIGVLGIPVVWAIGFVGFYKWGI